MGLCGGFFWRGPVWRIFVACVCECVSVSVSVCVCVCVCECVCIGGFRFRPFGFSTLIRAIHINIAIFSTFICISKSIIFRRSRSTVSFIRICNCNCNCNMNDTASERDLDYLSWWSPENCWIVHASIIYVAVAGADEAHGA